MLRFGTVSEINAAKGLVRVRFEEDGIVSGWLPMVQSGTLKNKSYALPDETEHVACLMDEHAENGVVVGCLYNSQDTPGFSSRDKVGVKFESGDEIVYDRDARAYLVKTAGTELKITPGGPTLKKGGESLKAILVDLLAQILAETHPTAVGPTGPPINSAAYVAIKTRIENFFEN